MDGNLIIAIIACLGSISTLAVALTAYVKQKTENEKNKSRLSEIESSRATTKAERDKEAQEFRDKAQKAEWEIKYLKDELLLTNSKLEEQAKVSNTLNVEIAKMSTKVDQVLSAIEELKKYNRE